MRKPKYVQEVRDRYGKVRCYLRRPGHKAVPLPGVIWTPTFMAAYEAAMKGEHYVKQALVGEGAEIEQAVADLDRKIDAL